MIVQRSFRRIIQSAAAAAFLTTTMLSGLAHAGPTLDKINQRGTIKVGVGTTPGFFAPDSNGKWQGFFIDFGRALSIAVFLIAAAYTLLSSEHVKVDLVYGHMPRKVQLWVEILGTLFFLFPFCLITIYLSWPIVISKFLSGEVSNNTGGLLLWPVWALIPIGFGLLALQGVSELIKRIAILRGDMPDATALADADAQTL